MSHRPRKRFGQHFLHDPQVLQRLLAAIDPRPGERLVEIGPGLGALTCPLLEAVGRLDVIELDPDVIPHLQARCGHLGHLQVHLADALAFDLAALTTADQRLRLVGNLPYNISTPLLFHVLEAADRITDMHFMLQKEVVDRLVAAPGGKDYGRLSVMLQYRCRMERLFQVGPGAFRPPPQVDSAVVRLVPYAAPPVHLDAPAVFAQVVALAFSQRRKTLRRILRGQLEPAELERTGIDPGARPETLALEDFARLANTAAAKRALAGG